MTIRTSVAFDPATVARWERLTKRWGVSKSEALRRALEVAEIPSAKTDEPDFSTMTPVEIMDWLREHPQVPSGWGEDYRAQLRSFREQDAEIEEEREQRRQEFLSCLKPNTP